MKTIVDINMSILYTLEKLRVPFFNYLFLGITYLGSEYMSIIAVFLIYWCVSKQKAWFIMANVLAGSGLNQIIKIVCHVPRPFVAHRDFTAAQGTESTAGSYSFPSGHTQNSTSFYGSAASVFKNLPFRILCLVMIVLVAFSRMYLGAHYPTDVLGGFANGLVVLIIMRLVFSRFEGRVGFIPVLFCAGGVIMAAAAIMLASGLWKTGADPEGVEEAAKTIGTFAGCMLGIAAGEPIERKYVNFETKAVWWAQILKIAIGLAIFAALMQGMKAVLQALIGNNSLISIPRFFVPSFFGVCIWPMTFRWFQSAGSGKRQV